MPGTRVISLLGLSACLAGGAAGDPVGVTDRGEALSVMIEAYTPCEGSRAPSAVIREEISSFGATLAETRDALSRVAAGDTVCSEVKQAARRLLSELDTQPDALAGLFTGPESAPLPAASAAVDASDTELADNSASIASLWTRPPGSSGLRRTSDY